MDNQVEFSHPQTAAPERPALISEYRGPAFQRGQSRQVPARVLAVCIAVGAGSGALLWASYFPVACGWLGWLALIPLLSLVRRREPGWVIYGTAWGAGFGFFLAALMWMRVADPMMRYTWIALSIYCSLFFPLAIFMLRGLDRWTVLPLTLTVPVVWTALEYFRAHFLEGFPWYFLGYTQHDFLILLQTADLGGVYLVTFLVAAFNALAFEMLVASGWLPSWFGTGGAGIRRWRCPLGIQGAAVLALLGSALTYGWWRLDGEHFTRGPRMALVQGNLGQGIRNQAASSEDAVVQMVRHYRELSDLGVNRDPGIDLLVWPETSFPGEWHEDADGRPDAESQELAHRIGGLWNTNVLLGLNAVVSPATGGSSRYNSALLIRRDGTAVGHYDKIHRVPFGEYVPLKDWLPWLEIFAPYDFDYSIQPGTSQPRLSLGSASFGVLICYEDTDPYLARQYVRLGSAGAPVDFLVNISNDGWFDGTSEHEEHLAICRFRAVESRRAVVRAVNMGISAVIDGSGRVLAPTASHPDPTTGAIVWEARVAARPVELPRSRWSEFKKVSGVFLADVPLDQRSSFYARWGDWLPQGCWVVIGVGLITGWRRRKKPV